MSKRAQGSGRGRPAAHAKATSQQRGPRQRTEIQLTSSPAPNKRRKTTSDDAGNDTHDTTATEDFFLDDNGDADQRLIGMQTNGSAADHDDVEAQETADEKRVRLAKEYLAAVQSEVEQEDEDEETPTDSDRLMKQLPGVVKQQQVTHGVHDDIEADEDDALLDDESRRGITTSTELRHKRIAERLHTDLLKSTRRYTTYVAEKYKHKIYATDKCVMRRFRGHSKTVTAVALSTDFTEVVTAAKDGCVYHYDIQTGKKLHTFQRAKTKKDTGHTKAVLAVDLSGDKRYIISGGYDKYACLWDTRTGDMVQKITSHRDTITSAVFTKHESYAATVAAEAMAVSKGVKPHPAVGALATSTELYTASYDRTVKTYAHDTDSSQYHYTDTLYGHQAPVTSISSISPYRILTGGADTSLRMFNTEKQTQLLYKGAASSVDCVAMLDESHYITGQQSGTLQLWNSNKKKPVCTVHNAHPTPAKRQHQQLDPDTIPYDKNWITAVAAVPYSDLVVTGSTTGDIRLWQIDPRASGSKRMQLIGTVQVPGIVNAIALSSNGQYVAVATGQEHKFGRWHVFGSGAKNIVTLFDLSQYDGEAPQTDETPVTADGHTNGLNGVAEG